MLLRVLYIVLFIASTAFWLFASHGSADAQEVSEIIAELLESIDADEMDEEARILTGIDPYNDETITSRELDNVLHDTAQDYLLGLIEEMGYSATLETFEHASYPCANIIVERPGVTSPEKIRIIGAHYDSDNNSDEDLPAPGAVDNASGVLIVLHVLKALSGYSFNDTIRFILFDAEEWGLVGSRLHAESAAERGDDIAVMLNLDVAGWRVPGINWAFANSDLSGWPFLQKMADIPNRYSCGTKVLGVPTTLIDTANMASFWDEGYAGIMIGSLYALTPYMNTELDTYDKLDIEQTAAVAKVMTAYLGEEAGLVGPIDDDATDDTASPDDTVESDDTDTPPLSSSKSDDDNGACGC